MAIKMFPSSPRYLPRPFYAAQLASRFLPQPMFHAAVAAVAAAGVAKSEPMKTGLQATRLAIGAENSPYMFVLSPELIMINPGITVIPKIITAIIGITCVSVGLTGYFKTNMNMLERIFLIIAGVLTLEPGFLTDIIGIVIIVVVYIYQSKKSKLN